MTENLDKLDKLQKMDSRVVQFVKRSKRLLGEPRTECACLAVAEYCEGRSGRRYCAISEEEGWTKFLLLKAVSGRNSCKLAKGT